MWNPSFYDYLTTNHPELLPWNKLHESISHGELNEGMKIPSGTTILALRYADGVVIGGDRMATEGFQVSARRMDKVFRCDEYSAIAIAGAAGACIEMAKLFQVELEHYEKLEGISLTMEGKANKLSQMIKANLPLAMQGLIVIPIFAGYDTTKGIGRIFKYDITGGKYEETEYYATGSGGKDARNTLKKRYVPQMPEARAVEIALEALYDASEEDIATAGPDMIRKIYPTIKIINRHGIMDVDASTIEDIYNHMIEEIKRNKGGS